MVALPVAPKVIRFDVHQTMLEDLNVMNRLFFQYSGTLSQTDLATLCATFATNWGSHIMAHLDTALKGNFIEGTDLSTNTSPRAETTFTTTGTNAAGPLANGTAVVISFGIQRRYRGGKPRIYLCGVPSGTIGSDGRFTSAQLTAWLGDMTAFVSGFTATPPAAVGTLSHVNVSYYQGFTAVRQPSGRFHNTPNIRATPVVDVITSYVVNPFPASQRRRNETP